MKLKEILAEGRIEYIAAQLGDKLIHAAHNDRSFPRQFSMSPESVLQQLTNIDPTPNKQLIQWIAKQYVTGTFRYEDAERLQQHLNIFIKNRNKIENKDLYGYKTVSDLYDVTEPLENTEQDKSKRQQKEQMKLEGAEYIINTPNFKIIHLKTGKAAQFYASGTRWCTSNDGTFESYARQGKIYVVILKQKDTTRKFQLHVESGQMMNEKDTPLTKSEITLLSSYPEWRQFLELLIKNHYKL